MPSRARENAKYILDFFCLVDGGQATAGKRTRYQLAGPAAGSKISFCDRAIERKPSQLPQNHLIAWTHTRGTRLAVSETGFSFSTRSATEVFSMNLPSRPSERPNPTPAMLR